MATRSKSDPAGSRSSSRGRRRLSPDERRRELLDAAERVLRDRGPADVRVEDITAAAETAKGNFYRYFATWDDLLLAVRDHLRDTYAQEIGDRIAARGEIDWWATLVEEVDHFVEFQLELGGLHDAVFHGPASRPRPIDDERSAATFIAMFLSAGIAAGAFADVDVEAVGLLFFHVLHGAADEIASGKDRRAIRAAALHIIRRTLEPDGER